MHIQVGVSRIAKENLGSRGEVRRLQVVTDSWHKKPNPSGSFHLNSMVSIVIPKLLEGAIRRQEPEC